MIHPKVTKICPALAAALKAHPSVKELFQKMAPSHQQEYNSWIASAVKPETQQARVAKALEMIGAKLK
jgi:uncharacterized protein YdeI (YjbR/CyaY-like superfamily)